MEKMKIPKVGLPEAFPKRKVKKEVIEVIEPSCDNCKKDCTCKDVSNLCRYWAEPGE